MAWDGLGRPRAAWGALGLRGATWGGLGLPGAAWRGLGRPGVAWGGLGRLGAGWEGRGRERRKMGVAEGRSNDAKSKLPNVHFEPFWGRGKGGTLLRGSGAPFAIVAVAHF